MKTSVGSLAVDSPEDIKPVEIELKKSLTNKIQSDYY